MSLGKMTCLGSDLGSVEHFVGCTAQEAFTHLSIQSTQSLRDETELQLAKAVLLQLISRACVYPGVLLRCVRAEGLHGLC